MVAARLVSRSKLDSVSRGIVGYSVCEVQDNKLYMYHRCVSLAYFMKRFSFAIDCMENTIGLSRRCGYAVLCTVTVNSSSSPKHDEYHPQA